MIEKPARGQRNLGYGCIERILIDARRPLVSADLPNKLE